MIPAEVDVGDAVMWAFGFGRWWQCVVKGHTLCFPGNRGPVWYNQLVEVSTERAAHALRVVGYTGVRVRS